MRGSNIGDFLFFAIVFGLVPVVMMISGVMVQRFRTQERLRAIEKGLPLPPEAFQRGSGIWDRRPPFDLRDVVTNLRLAGIICIAVGLWLLVLFTAVAETLPEFPKGVIAVSAVPFLLGRNCRADESTQECS